MTELAGVRACFNWLNMEPPEGGSLALKQHSAMNGFLREVERRALRIAELATGNRDDALEIVQDAMLGLARKYSERPEGEWKPLFYRILHSRINDFHRRRAVRSRVMALVPWSSNEEDAVADPISNASAGERENPEQALQREIANEAMLAAIGALPGRQQQAFMLRAWEGLSVRDTAIAMACGEGSVKTHYARALNALQEKLAGIRP
ncbi:MAG: RNA polymerase sigma factor [Halieaceae bacterium]